MTVAWRTIPVYVNNSEFRTEQFFCYFKMGVFFINVTVILFSQLGHIKSSMSRFSPCYLTPQSADALAVGWIDLLVLILCV